MHCQNGINPRILPVKHAMDYVMIHVLSGRVGPWVCFLVGPQNLNDGSFKRQCWLYTLQQGWKRCLSLFLLYVYLKQSPKLPFTKSHTDLDHLVLLRNSTINQWAGLEKTTFLNCLYHFIKWPLKTQRKENMFPLTSMSNKQSCTFKFESTMMSLFRVLLLSGLSQFNALCLLQCAQQKWLNHKGMIPLRSELLQFWINHGSDDTKMW